MPSDELNAAAIDLKNTLNDDEKSFEAIIVSDNPEKITVLVDDENDLAAIPDTHQGYTVEKKVEKIQRP